MVEHKGQSRSVEPVISGAFMLQLRSDTLPLVYSGGEKTVHFLGQVQSIICSSE